MHAKHVNLRLAACCLAMAAASGACRAQANFEEDFDDADKPWQEIAVQLPPLPAPEDMVELFVSATATQTFAVDAKSVSVGADGVVRYTLVAVSQGGVRNVSYEGIRCQSFEKKLYAFGHADGTWSRSRSDQWQRIRSNAANRQHAALAKDYFCDGLMVAGSGADIVRRLKAGQALTR
jgi:hypothetical protein